MKWNGDRTSLINYLFDNSSNRQKMAEQRQYTYGNPYRFNGKESDEDFT
jgi:hypothetical protein